MKINKKINLSYKLIRKLSYEREEKVLKSDYNFDMNNWSSSPYTCFKIRFNIEISVLIVYFLKNININPNHISYIYALSAFVASICFYSNNVIIIFLGIFLFFFKGVIDNADGLLARLKFRTTNLGAIVDTWGGMVSEICFMLALGLYLFNHTSQITYIWLMIFSIIFKSIDIKRYAYAFVGAGKYNQSIFLKEKNNTKSKSKKIIKRLNKNIFKRLIIDGFNYNARTMDLILFGIVVELLNKELIFTHYFFYFYLFRGIIIFFGNIYIINKEEFLINLLKNNIKIKK